MMSRLRQAVWGMVCTCVSGISKLELVVLVLPCQASASSYTMGGYPVQVGRADHQFFVNHCKTNLVLSSLGARCTCAATRWPGFGRVAVRVDVGTIDHEDRPIFYLNHSDQS